MVSTGQRLFILLILALVAAADLVLWGLLGFIYFLLRTGDPFGPLYTPAELTQHEQLFEITAAMFIVNVVGCVVFIIRRRGFGLFVLAAVQIADIAVTIAMRDLRGGTVVAVNAGLATVPATGLVLLGVLWRYSPRPLSGPSPVPDV